MSLLEQLQRLGSLYKVKMPLMMMCDLVDLIHRQRMEAIENYEHRILHNTQPKV